MNVSTVWDLRERLDTEMSHKSRRSSLGIGYLRGKLITFLFWLMFSEDDDERECENIIMIVSKDCYNGIDDFINNHNKQMMMHKMIIIDDGKDNKN